ncbi:adenosylcobinamide kinase /adenosylcobinamide-phosphate guanylyltransferase [Nakamurella panacisegetis]|uniref:Adenosylcobinamide kinase n=1 Tax=Nakamurella panacisegetis TaxID=1090615 RepID=A0A1H0HYK2_9ACTN|nr:bifunctional adenosylcobinamide kinase/adenosylcobinamide-phosphate guanylyltransferase [Nakamurella panacisegetis]SDO24326.1 adenosylcobinamide kinase /adenosylcobinamide-phosphate guanylyltransferase [Nakamurella panacisegetis]
MTVRSTLVTGGVRSGKSAYAESLLQHQQSVTYVAPGPIPDPVADPDWAERVALHQARRPAHWSTVETIDVAAAVRAADGAVLVDCLGTWVTALMDDLRGWDRPAADWRDEFDHRVQELTQAWVGASGPLVAVTNEVGMGILPEHRSGRLFRDLLGTVNQGIAAVSDDVLLVVAGRVLRL